MPKYVPVVLALLLAAGPAAATLSPAPSPARIGPQAEPHGARIVPAAPSIGPQAEPHG